MSELTQRSRELIAAARAEERVREGQREEVRAALAALLPAAPPPPAPPSAPAPAGAAGAAAAPAAGTATLARVLIGVAVASAAGVGGWRIAAGASARRPAAAPVAAVAPAAPRLEPPIPAADVREEIELPAQPLPAAAAPPARAATRPARPPKSAPPAAVPSGAAPADGPAECAFADELGVLRDGQRALGEGRAEEALSALDDFRARCSSGALREEREAARILALCALGRLGEARREAERFRAEAPRSPLLGRIDSACAGRKEERP